MGNTGSQGKNSSPKDFTNSVQDVLEAERKRINDNEALLGLALSGGGIRSASFALGLLQSLVHKDQNLLKEVDYLSTVSGGGYIGSSLTYFLNKGLPEWESTKEKKTPKVKWIKSGTTEDNFPFGRKGIGARNNNPSEKDFNGNEILDFIRQHGKYLTPSPRLGAMSLFGVVFRSTLVSLLVYFSFLTLITLLFYCWGLFSNNLYLSFFGNELVSINEFLIYEPLKGYYPTNILLTLGIFTSFLIIIYSILYSLATGFTTLPYKRLVASQKNMGSLWKISISLIVLGTMPLLKEWVTPIISGGFASFGVLLGIYEQLKSNNPSKSSSNVRNIRILIGAVLLIYGLVSSSFYLAKWFSEFFGENVIYVQIALFGFVVFVGLFVNLNVFGLHRMYRDRLMETFMADGESILKNNWGKATKANSTYIKDMCSKVYEYDDEGKPVLDENGDKIIISNNRPYHIINTNLVTINSSHPKFNGRGGDNFILSPLYCGSDATGWECSKSYRTHRFRNNGITLATAMAISGAAINHSAGPNSQGLTKSRPVSFFLGLLNIQLGFWSDKPSSKEHKSRFKKYSKSKLPSNFLIPGLYGNILGKNLTENNPNILLTDGGHFENLGAYELIRRKLKVIIISDAGADPDFKFQDLTNLIEKVRVDFGTTIVFRESFPIESLIPSGDIKGMGNKIHLAKRGYAIADIYYNDEESGLLVYLKSTLDQNLPKDLYGYKLNNPSFPDESTADQFFSEVQFEAYRELGYQLGKSVEWGLIKSYLPDRILDHLPAPDGSCWLKQ